MKLTLLRTLLFSLLLSSSILCTSVPARAIVSDDALSDVDSDSETAISKMSAAELESRGDALRSQKEYNDALNFYERAAKLEKKNAALWNKMGITALQLRRTDLAIQFLGKATKYDRKYAEALNNLGVAYYLRKEYRRSVDLYRKAIKLSDSASFHSNLGAVYFDMAQYSAALKEYTRALQLDPEVLERTSVSGVSAHVSRPEDRARYSFLLAKLYAQLGDVDHALNQLKRAMENGYPDMKSVYTQAEFASVRQDPRFTELMAAPPIAITP